MNPTAETLPEDVAALRALLLEAWSERDAERTNQEAAAHYRSAKQLLEQADLPTGNSARAPEVLMKLGNAQMQTVGYHSEEVLQSYQQAHDAALALALKLANDDPTAIQYFYKDSFLNDGHDLGSWHQTSPPPSPNNNPWDPQNKVRDGLGTTHHEAGTLWMGADPNTSVTGPMSQSKTSA